MNSKYFSGVAIFPLAFAFVGGVSTAATAQQDVARGGVLSVCSEGQAVVKGQGCSSGANAFQSQAKDEEPSLKSGPILRPLTSDMTPLAGGIVHADAIAPSSLGAAGDMPITDMVLPPALDPAESLNIPLSGVALAAGNSSQSLSSTSLIAAQSTSLGTAQCAIDGPANFMLDGWNSSERGILEAAKAAFIQDSAWRVLELAPSEVERRLRTDAVLRWKFAPFMIEAAWKAFLSENRTAAQTSFVNRFSKWSGCDKRLTARRNLSRWAAFTGEASSVDVTNGQNIGITWIDPNPGYKPFTFSNLTDTGPSVSDFDVTNNGNPLYIGGYGVVAIGSLLKPAFIKLTEIPDPEGLRYVDDDFRSVMARAGVGVQSPVPVWPMTGLNFEDKGVTSEDVYNTYEALTSGTNTILSLLGVDLSFPTKDATSARGVLETVLTPVITNLISAVAPSVGNVVTSGGFSFAATILEAKLTDVIGTARYKEALERDASNTDPVPIVPSRLRFDTNRNGWDSATQPEDVERAALFGLLLKFLIAEPTDARSLTLRAPALDCPIGMRSERGGCVTNIRFFRQENVTLRQAQAIAASNNWFLASREAVEQREVKYPTVYGVGLTADGSRIFPPAGRTYVGPEYQTNAALNKGFFYVPKLFAGRQYGLSNIIIQSAVDFGRLGDDPWIISRAWSWNPDIYDFGDPKDPKYGAFLMESRTSRGEYAYNDNGSFEVGRISPNDPRAQWRFLTASKGFSWIKPHASPEKYLKMRGGALQIGYSEPNDKGALWYTGGIGQNADIRSPTVPDALPEGEFPPVPGFVRLQNNWYKNSYVHNESKSLGFGEIKANWWSAMWRKVPITDGWFVFESRFQPNQYLHIQNGKLEVSSVPCGKQCWSAQWRELPVSDGWVRIQNRWKPSLYLNNKGNGAEAVEIKSNWASALWKVK